MTIVRRLCPAAALLLALALPAAAKDVYKAFLDPGIPQHRATLDILARLEKTPNDASLHNDLGCLIARDGFWRDALREFETAEKLDKKDGRAPYNAGLVQMTRGEWGAARSAFKKAVDRNPGNWPAWWMLGFAEENLGNTASAVQAYERSLRVDTSLFDVKRNPYAVQSRLRARALLDTYDARLARAALPETEQLAQPEILTAFQAGRVSVSAAPGSVVPDDTHPRAVVSPGPGGSPSGGPSAAAAPASGGAVVTSVPPVSSSRPSPPARAPEAAAPVRSGNIEEAPPWFPQTSPAGAAPPKTPRAPGTADPGAPPAPPPPPPGPGPGVG